MYIYKINNPKYDESFDGDYACFQASFKISAINSLLMVICNLIIYQRTNTRV